MKKALQLFFMTLSVLIFSACSTEPMQIDIEALANDLIQNAHFEDELNRVDTETAENMYDIDHATSSCVYISSGATAEEIAAFAFENTQDAAQALEKAKARILQQKKSFDYYIPKEVSKIDHAVINQYENYLIVCISSDQEAEKIISKYIK